MRANLNFIFGIKRVEKYINTGQDQNITDADPHSIYTKRKEHRKEDEDNSLTTASSPQPNYPSDGWSGNIKRMPFFTRIVTVVRV